MLSDSLGRASCTHFRLLICTREFGPARTGVSPYRSPSKASPEERRFLNELGSDILKHRPKLVFIEAADNCQACPKNFRVEEYLASAGWLESFMKNYKFTGSLHEFSVYVRVD